MIYALIVLFFTLGYVGLILFYLNEWNALPTISASNTSPNLFLSIIVPARNEEKNIPFCILSILEQDYPAHLLEVIVVNDHSTDKTAEWVLNFPDARITLLNLEDIPQKEDEVAYKKRAIEEGIKVSKGEIIVTTDADCNHHINWLSSIASVFQERKVNIISSPVLFHYEDNFFQKFQALDFLGMMGITAASIHSGMYNLANGANLAYRKSVFNQVNGYQGIDSKASGDDMLLIYKFAQIDAEKVCFLKSKTALAYTRPAFSLKAFIQQRLRWTSKSFHYQDHRITLILAFVYIVNVLLAVSLIIPVITGQKIYILFFVFQLIVMSIVDYIFLQKIASFFNRKDLLQVFVPSQFLHVLYIIIIGLLGNLVKYNWKGRKLK